MTVTTLAIIGGVFFLLVAIALIVIIYLANR